MIGEAVSRAEARLTATGTVERTASFSLTGISVAGVVVSLGPGGFTLPGTALPLPDGDRVLGPLAEQGIGISYVEPLETAHGVVAGGLRITLSGTAPDGTRGTWTMTLGRALASVETAAGGRPSPEIGVDLGTDTEETPPAAVGESAPDSGGGSAVAVPSPPPDTAAAAGRPRSSAAVAASGNAPAIAGPNAATVDGAAGAGADEAATDEAVPAAAVPVPTLAGPDSIRRVVEPLDIAGFYPMLVVAAAMAYAVAQGLRILGVR